jgi:hypothetical protein
MLDGIFRYEEGKKMKNSVKRKEVVKWWKEKLEKEKSYETNKLYHPNDSSKSFQPSDHCYNKTNIADIRNGFPKNHELLFWYEEHGIYIYKGSRASVTVEVVWTDINKKETIIGKWYKGIYKKTF